MESLLVDLAEWWKYEEEGGIRTGSHNGLILTDTNTVGWSASGVNGNCGDWEASNSERLSIADTPLLSSGDIDLTISVHVRAESLPDYNNRPIVCKGSSFDYFGYTYEYCLLYEAVYDFRFMFSLKNGAVFRAATSAGKPTPNTWYHILAWHYATTNQIGISVNGVSNTSSYSGGMTDTTSSFLVGGLPASAGGPIYWDGLIDELAIWKRSLTAEENAYLAAGNTYPVASASDWRQRKDHTCISHLLNH